MAAPEKSSCIHSRPCIGGEEPMDMRNCDELPESSQRAPRAPKFYPKTQPLLHTLLRWRRQPKIDLFSSNFKSPISNKRLNLYCIYCPGGGSNAVMATMTLADTDKNQLKWHQKKWQLWPVVVMAAATGTILTLITATMAAVAGSGDGGGESCDGSGEQREALFSPR